MQFLKRYLKEVVKIKKHIKDQSEEPTWGDWVLGPKKDKYDGLLLTQERVIIEYGVWSTISLYKHLSSTVTFNSIKEECKKLGLEFPNFNLIVRSSVYETFFISKYSPRRLGNTNTIYIIIKILLNIGIDPLDIRFVCTRRSFNYSDPLKLGKIDEAVFRWDYMAIRVKFVFIDDCKIFPEGRLPEWGAREWLICWFVPGHTAGTNGDRIVGNLFKKQKTIHDIIKPGVNLKILNELHDVIIVEK
jgi:hypothetical protein